MSRYICNTYLYIVMELRVWHNKYQIGNALRMLKDKKTSDEIFDRNFNSAEGWDIYIYSSYILMIQHYWFFNDIRFYWLVGTPS